MRHALRHGAHAGSRYALRHRTSVGRHDAAWRRCSHCSCLHSHAVRRWRPGLHRRLHRRLHSRLHWRLTACRHESRLRLLRIVHVFRMGHDEGFLRTYVANILSRKTLLGGAGTHFVPLRIQVSHYSQQKTWTIPNRTVSIETFLLTEYIYEHSTSRTVHGTAKTASTCWDQGTRDPTACLTLGSQVKSSHGLTA